MAVRAVRGAIQVDADDREQILDATTELLQAVLSRNDLTAEDLISVVFTAAYAAISAERAAIARSPRRAAPAGACRATVPKSTAAVTSSLQRARATLARQPGHRNPGNIDADQLARYQDAFRRYDIAALVRIIRVEAGQVAG